MPRRGRVSGGPRPAPAFRTAGAAAGFEANLAAGVATAPPEPQPEPLKLQTMADVAAAIEDVARRMMAGELGTIEGVRLTKVLTSLSQAMGGAAIQDRLDRIERTLQRDRRMR